MRALLPHLALAVLVGLGACGEPDADGDGFPIATDCDESDPAINPEADEICDGIDNNCDGWTDDEMSVVDAPLWYIDRDVDGFGDETVFKNSCERPGGGWAEVAGDCDDTNPDARPDAYEICNGFDDDCDGIEDEPDEAEGAEIWYEDWDFDTFGDPETAQLLCPQQVPRLWVQNGDDCNDKDDAQYPGAPEFCNDQDDDCDEAIDELSEVVDGFDAWQDNDEDGYGDPATTVFVCTLPEGHVTNNDDCNDDDEIVALGCGCTTGESGDLNVLRGNTVTLEAGILHYKNVFVESGGTLRFTGNVPVYLFAENVNVAGTIDIAAAETVPGPGGGAGGKKGVCYSVGNKGGNAALVGKGGGAGGTYPYSTGGGGGGHADYGADGAANTYSAGGVGGDRFGEAALEIEFGGGGGGGAGGNQGGAGGGGGGALKIVAGEILVSGVINANGADAQDATGSCYYGGGGGGGGAGGAVWLHGDRVDFTGSIFTEAGVGSKGFTNYYYTGTLGGDGSIGRARVSGKILNFRGETTDSAWTDDADPSCETVLDETEE